MTSGNGKISGMEEAIRNLNSNFEKMRLYILDREQKRDERDERSQDWREGVTASLGIINQKLEVGNAQHIKHLEYQKECDTERKILMGRIIAIENFQDNQKNRTAYVAGIAAAVVATIIATALIAGARVLEALAK